MTELHRTIARYGVESICNAPITSGTRPATQMRRSARDQRDWPGRFFWDDNAGLARARSDGNCAATPCTVGSLMRAIPWG